MAQWRRLETEKTLFYMVRTGVILVLFTPLIVTTSTFFPFVVGKALYARSIIEITFVLWLALAFRYPRHRLPRSWILLAFGVYLSVTVVAGFAGVSLLRSLWSTYERMQGIVDLAHWFAFTLVLVSVFRSSPDWRLLLNFNLGISLWVGILGLIEHYGIGDVPFYGFLGSGQGLNITFGNPTFVGTYMLVNLFIGLALLSQSIATPSAPAPVSAARRRGRRRIVRAAAADRSLVWWRAFWITAIALAFWILALSGTRGALMGVAAGFVAFALGYIVWGESKRARLVALGALGALGVAALGLALSKDTAVVEKVTDSSATARRLVNVVDIDFDDASFKSRRASWSAGLEAFASRPILGWGPENYEIAYGRYILADPTVTGEGFDQAHNKLVEELTTEGISGLLSYLALWALTFWILVRRLGSQHASERLFMLFIGAGLIGYFVQNLLLFDTPATLLQFILLLGLVASLEVRAEVVTVTTSSRSRKRGNDVGEMQGDGRTRLAFHTILAIGLASVAFSVYSLNYRLYEGAAAVKRASSSDLMTWDQRLDHFDRSINSFRPLANLARLALFNGLAKNWDTLSPAQAAAALVVVREQAELALEIEPQGWRIYVALARLYQSASTFNPESLDIARDYIIAADKLAQGTVAVQEIHVRQQKLEKELERKR